MFIHCKQTVYLWTSVFLGNKKETKTMLRSVIVNSKISNTTEKYDARQKNKKMC